MVDIIFFTFQHITEDVTVLGHLAQCGQKDTETCLAAVKLNIAETSVSISPCQVTLNLKIVFKSVFFCFYCLCSYCLSGLFLFRTNLETLCSF